MAANRRKFDWLGLIDVSGPFLTLSVLNDSFQFGLDAHESGTYRAVKEAYDEWEGNPSPAIHHAWVRFLLENVLGYPAEMIGEAQAIPESAVASLESQSERIRPSLVILDAEDPRIVRLPILVYPRSQKLDSPLAGSSWSASPHTRMQVLLQNTGFQVGFVTNGAQWSLVHVRKGEPTGFATWQTMLFTEEKELLQAFVGILGQERTFGTSADQTLFALLDKSSHDQEEVTKELGRQVRQAVEVFVNALDRLDRDSERRLLADVDPKTAYNGALTVMMRLIFLLCAEERGLMDSRPLYVQNYSVGALNDQLREEVRRTGNEDLLEHRHDAWMRLLATFRLVHGGCGHEDLNLPAYGGSLFDPARYPFLEKAHVNNRVTLHLLDALEYLEIRLPRLGRETRRLSFRALGVEQIGHVYEGLLDHTAMRAEEPVVGLTGKEAEEDEIALSLLEENASGIGEFFGKRKIKISGNSNRLLQQHSKPEAQAALGLACGADEALYERVLPFLNLVRQDSLHHLQVYPTGSLYVTAGAERRATGTHYTPVTLTDEVVKYALEPVVYVGPAEGLNPPWKLKSAKDIIDLKVCDMAMGSGAFLVQACRYLAERLVEAWGIAREEAGRPLGFSNEGHYFTRRIEGDHAAKGPGTLIETPLGNLAVADPSAELISDEPEERLAQARRVIADRCLYGVDINPMAVEMAKLSLWLTTMERNRPFTFLDHALKVGDSLISVNLRQLRSFNMLVDKDKRLNTLLLPWVPERVRELQGLRKQILAIPSHDAGAVERKRFILDKFNRTASSLRYVADRLLGIELSRGSRKDKDSRRLSLITELGTSPERVDSLAAQDAPLLETKRFHWELEFADALLDDTLEGSNASGRAGFNAFVGNPPFVGGQKITGIMGTAYRDFLVTHLANGMNGSADLCAYFFLNAAGQLKATGLSGLIATNTIAQGDTREVGLEQVVQRGYTIPRATKSRKWPGSANLEISQVWLFRGQWRHTHVLDGRTTATITSFLDDGTASGKPLRLRANEGLSFQGSIVLGMGFVLSSEEAERILDLDVRNQEVLYPYLNGEDLNSRPDQTPSRWVVNFFDWPLGRVGQFLPLSGEAVLETVKEANGKRSPEWFPKPGDSWCMADEEHAAKWVQLGVVPEDYPHPVAADYPEVLRIVEERVRTERQRPAEKGPDERGRNFQLRSPLAEKWWIYGEKRPELYRTLKRVERCLVMSLVGQYVSFGFSPPKIVFAHKLAVFPLDSYASFAALQSAFHYHWAWQYSSTMRIDLNYSPSDCFETFPLPDLTPGMEAAGAVLYESRQRAMVNHSIGMTDLARLVHNPAQQDLDVVAVRDAIAAVDAAVRESYGWPEIDLSHGFHGENRERRFGVSPDARMEMLRRLLALNAERYADEVRRGLHDKKAAKPRRVEDDAFSGPRRNLFDEQPTLGEMF